MVHLSPKQCLRVSHGRSRVAPEAARIDAHQENSREQAHALDSIVRFFFHDEMPFQAKRS